jgi:hypothetical protein
MHTTKVNRRLKSFKTVTESARNSQQKVLITNDNQPSDSRVTKSFLMAVPYDVGSDEKKERISEFLSVVMEVEDADVFMHAFWLAD